MRDPGNEVAMEKGTSIWRENGEFPAPYLLTRNRQQWRPQEKLVLLYSVSLPWEELQFVVITVNVTNCQGSFAVRIVCAENPVITARSIPIVVRVNSAVMAETACRIVLQVQMGLWLPSSALYSARSWFLRSLFLSWLVSVVLVVRTTAIVPIMGPSS